MELDSGRQRRKFRPVQPRVSVPNTKIGLGTIAAALIALSMAVLGQFFI